MFDAKITTLLRSFDTDQLKSFKDFVASPYFNRQKALIPLYDIFLKFAPDFSSNKYRLDYIAAQLNPDKGFKVESLQKQISALYKLSEQFLKVEGQLNLQFEGEFALLKHFEEQELDKLYKKQYDKILKGLVDQPIRSKHYYKELFELKNEHGHFLVTREDKGVGDVMLQEASDTFDIYYILGKMRLFNQMINRQQLVDQSYDFGVIDPLLAFVEKRGFTEVPSVEVWVQALKMQMATENHRAQYDELKRLLFKYADELDDEDVRTLFVYLHNILIRHLRNDSQLFLSDMFELYNAEISTGTILQRGQISPAKYRNIVVIAIRMGKTEWAKDFMEQFKSKIYNRFGGRDDLYNYTKGLVLFAEQNFDEVLNILNENRYKNIFFKLHARRLRLQTYYELEMYSIMDDLINSTRKFLTDHKNEMSDYHLTANRNFLNLVQKTVNCPNKDEERAETLLTEMNSLPPSQVPERAWIAEKLDQKIA